MSYVTTGAVIPKGADAVVKIEDTERCRTEDGLYTVRIKVASKPGSQVRREGFDVERGQKVVTAGEASRTPTLTPILTLTLTLTLVGRS